MTSTRTLRRPRNCVIDDIVAVTSAAPAPFDSSISPTRRARSSDRWMSLVSLTCPFWGPGQPTRILAGMADWQPDVLGDGYEQQVLELGDDPDGQGQIVGTLVRREAPEKPNGAVLYVHGFTDYFFQTALADFFTDRGFAFFALDLRKCGRSRRPGQTPHYVSDLRLYDDAELSRALAAVRHETGDAPVLLAGHSTGGLVLPLWLDRLNAGTGGAKGAGISGLVLNSPVPRPAGQAVDAELGHAAVPGDGEDPSVRAAQAAAHHGYGCEPARQRARRVGLRPGVEADRGLPGHLRLDQRHPPRPRPPAPGPRRRRAVAGPPLGA